MTSWTLKPKKWRRLLAEYPPIGLTHEQAVAGNVYAVAHCDGKGIDDDVAGLRVEVLQVLAQAQK